MSPNRDPSGPFFPGDYPGFVPELFSSDQWITACGRFASRPGWQGQICPRASEDALNEFAVSLL